MTWKSDTKFEEKLTCCCYFDRQSFKYCPMTSSLWGKIGQLSDKLCAMYHWTHNSILINIYYTEAATGGVL